MAYDPDNPPSLIASGIGGSRGLKAWAWRGQMPIAEVIGASYIRTARKLGMGVGDSVRYVDGNDDAHHLVLSAIDPDTGYGTVSFPQTSEEAYPIDADPSGEIYVVAYVDGEQVRISPEDLPEPPLDFASQAEAEAGVATDKPLNALRTKQAIDSQRAYASQAEAEAGLNNAKVMTSLRVGQAIAALQRAIASQAEAEAGTENTKAMTALRTSQAITALQRALASQAEAEAGALNTLDMSPLRTKQAIDARTYVAPGTGGTSRLVSGRMAEIISVKDYNAVGDGVADDTTAFQNALNRAKSSGAILFVPTGRYKITATLLFDRSADASGSAGLRMVGDGPNRSVLINAIAAGGPTLDITTGAASKYQFGGMVAGLGFEQSGSGANSHGIRYRSCFHQIFRDLRFENLNGAGLKVVNSSADADASSQVIIENIYAVGLEGAAWDSASSTGGVALHSLRQVNAVSCSKTFGNAYIIIDGAIQFSMDMCSLSGGAADNIRPLVSIRSTNVRARQIDIRGGEFGNNAGTHFEVLAVSNLHVWGIRHVRRASEANSTIGFDLPDGSELYSDIVIENVELQIDDATPVWTWIRHGTGASASGKCVFGKPNVSNFASGNVYHSFPTSGSKDRPIVVEDPAGGGWLLAPWSKRQRVIFVATGSITPDLTLGDWYQAQLNVSGAFTVQVPSGGAVDGREMTLTIFKDGTNTITWAAGYEAPTVPTLGGTFQFKYDGLSAIWRLLRS